ncbi:MAG: alpha/beta hydrolase [Phycisphaerales bacterium]
MSIRRSTHRVGSILLYLVLAAVLVYAIWGLVLLFMQHRLLYRPLREVIFAPSDRDLPHEDVVFHSRDGVKLAGWYLPAPQAHFTLLFCHGNGGNIMHVLDSMELFHRMGLNCLVFDYRGYGNSEGKPTEAGTYRDARAAFDWLTQAKGIPADRIIVCGRSLGGSIAAHLAAEVQPAALVVESAFTSYPDIGARFYPYMPVRLFSLFRYNTLSHIEKVRCPVMVVHSKDDDFVPYDFGVRLFKAASEPKRFVEITGGHNDGFLVSVDQYREAWTGWLDLLKSGTSAVAVTRVS